MRVVLDTNRYGDFCRGDAHVHEVLEQADRLFMPFAVIGELRAGFLGGTRSEQNENTLQKFLSREDVEVLYPDEQTTHHYARLFVQLRKQGKLIPANDIWIAALCVQHGLTLCARDTHFDHLPQIPRV